MDALDEYDVIGLTIGAHAGSITGRTAIQKLIYFAKVKIPSIDVTYTHHYYGPFSRNIAIDPIAIPDIIPIIIPRVNEESSF